MERVDPAKGRLHLSSRRSGKQVRKESAKGLRFSSVLDLASDSPAGATAFDTTDPMDSGDLEAVLDEIFDVGERVKENPTPEYVREYKRSVRNLLRHVVERGLGVEEHLADCLDLVLVDSEFVVAPCILDFFASVLLPRVRAEHPPLFFMVLKTVHKLFFRGHDTLVNE